MIDARAAIALGIALALIALAVSLGNWQLRRADEKLALQAQWDRAEQAPPLVVTGADIGAVAARLPVRVALRGRFLFEHEVWLDNRQMDGGTGLMLISPLRLADGTVVLINRGFAPRDPRDRTRLPAVERPPGELDLEGLAVAQPSRVLQIGANAPIGAAGPAVWQNLDFDAFASASGLTVPRWVVQQVGGSGDGLLRNWPRQRAGVDMHRGYALQWYSLAALIVALTLFFGVRALRRRHCFADRPHD